MAVSSGSKASRTTIGKKANTTKFDALAPSKAANVVGGGSASSRTTTGRTSKTGLTDATGKRGGSTPAPTIVDRSNTTADMPFPGTPSLNQVPSGVNPASGTGGGTNVTGAPLTGWASGIRPDAIPMMYQEPQALLRQVMAKMGMSAGSNPGLYNMALPNADLVNALALVSMGADPGFEQGNNDAVLNFMGDYFSQGLTPGGRGVDFGAGIDNIMGAGADTALGGYLNLDDPRGQVQAVKSLIGPLAQAGLHPLFARALDNQINRLADEYYQEYGFGDNPQPNFQSNIRRLF